MKYLSILGRNSELSLAELSAQFEHVSLIAPNLATFETNKAPDINRLGGQIKLATPLSTAPLEYLSSLPEGKLTFAISDYSRGATIRTANLTALKFKKILTRHHRSVRVIEGKSATVPTATTLHNGLSGKNPRKVELIKHNTNWYRVIGVQDIDAYAQRDQARPARDARVGMLPPKLAQILINLCGPLPAGARVLDPFCGTGVVLQEALLMGYQVYGTDKSERMVEYTRRNLEWLDCPMRTKPEVNVGDATSFHWTPPVDAVACETYLGAPMSAPPTDIKLKSEKQTCSDIVRGFLENLSPQIAPDSPVVVAVPAWLRPSGNYSRLFNFSNEGSNPYLGVDLFERLGYNVSNRTVQGLLYFREGQIVARDILILRKI